MKSEELRALGLTDEKIKQVQELHGRDMQRFRLKIQRGGAGDAGRLREAISSMLAVLNDLEHLRRVLSEVTYLYYRETRGNKDEKESENMPYYAECEKCGAKLDPGEKCDCTKENEGNADDAKKEAE